jgi:hypothetical protein
MAWKAASPEAYDTAGPPRIELRIASYRVVLGDFSRE